jgi:hypothetical protein
MPEGASHLLFTRVRRNWRDWPPNGCSTAPPDASFAGCAFGGVRLSIMAPLTWDEFDSTLRAIAALLSEPEKMIV